MHSAHAIMSVVWSMNIKYVTEWDKCFYYFVEGNAQNLYSRVSSIADIFCCMPCVFQFGSLIFWFDEKAVCVCVYVSCRLSWKWRRSFASGDMSILFFFTCRGSICLFIEVYLMWSIKKATTVIATRTFYYRCKYAFSFTKHKVKANILYETLSVNKKLQHEFFSLFQIYTCSWKNVAGCKFCWWACTFLRTEAFVVYRPVSVHWPGIFFSK